MQIQVHYLQIMFRGQLCCQLPNWFRRMRIAWVLVVSCWFKFWTGVGFSWVEGIVYFANYELRSDLL